MTEKEKIMRIARRLNCQCNIASDFLWSRLGSDFTVVIKDGYVTKISSMYLDVPALEIISDFKKLEHLDLTRFSTSSGEISRLPDCMAKLTTLKVLNLSYVGITEVPEWIGCFTELEELIVRHNPIKEVPDSMYSLSKLKGLSLNHTNLIRLSKDVCNLVSLEWLDVHQCTHKVKLPNPFHKPLKLKELRR